MKLRKTIDELYLELKGYDIVITPDAALSEALNRRIDNPRLGPFATTVKQYVMRSMLFKSNDFVYDDIDIVNSLAVKSGYKRAHYYLRLLKDCLFQRGEISRNLISVPEFIKIPDHVFDFFEKKSTYYKYLESFRIESTKKTAVVEKLLFDNAEVKVLPKSACEISLFKEDDSKAPHFSMFENAHELINAVCLEINEDNQQDIAIVVSDGIYSNVLKSFLQEKNLSIIGSKDIMDDMDFRRRLSILRMSVAPENLRIKDIVGIVNTKKYIIPAQFYGYYVKDYPDDAAGYDDIKELFKKINIINKMTFGEYINTFPILAGKRLEEIIKKYNMMDKYINDSFRDFEYFLVSFGSEIDTSRKGIIFADAKSSSFVDRPIVFYIMPDNSWIAQNLKRLWVEKEKIKDFKKNNIDYVKNEMREVWDKKHEKELVRFSSLIQSGSKRYFMANDTKRSSTGPCYYFQELGNNFIKSFKDDKDAYIEYSSSSKRKGNKNNISRKQFTDKYKVSTISTTRLNSFVECPRRYFFKFIIKEHQNEHLLKGNLLHQFAEFNFHFPELVKEKGNIFFVDILVSEISHVVEDIYIPLYLSHFSNAIENISSFIEDVHIQNTSLFCDKDILKKDNIFIKKLYEDVKNRKARKGATECSFIDNKLNINGKIDLIVSNLEVVDYKTSLRVMQASSHIKSSNVKRIKDEVNFQAILYLCFLRSKQKDKGLTIKFYYPLADLATKMAGNDSKEILPEVLVSYYPMTFKSFTETEECFEKLCEKSKARREFLENIGFDEYKKTGISSIDIEKNNMLDSIDALLECYGKSTITARKTAEGILKKLIKIRDLYFFKEDLDSFESFVKEQLERIEECHKKGFPAQPLSLPICRKCSYADICGMVCG
ncbi:MAG: PD-(D/E)XK nuclease family protein [Candidatus Aureabacteria bacterium]|nr:PD-(D/E)XK nuclease family protein [Candidatus Auribacterota bacterium]